MEGEFKELFEPIKIGPIEIKNRIAMAPMATGFSTYEGFVTEQDMAWYAARAKGGTGLIITSVCFSSKFARETQGILNVMSIESDAHISGHTRLVERVHAFGAKVFLQLTAGLGRQGLVPGCVAPSPIPVEARLEVLPKGMEIFAINGAIRGAIPRELTIEEIAKIEDWMADAANRAKIAGYDGIEIHSPHGYLIWQFLSPRTNKRTDLYGGTFENRLRFLKNIIKKIRAKIGKEMALGVRLACDEHVDGGLTIDDVIAIIKEIKKEVDFIHLSDGCYEAMKYLFPDKDGAMLEEARKIKEECGEIPIITPSVHDPKTAAEAIRNGWTDMVSLGRQLIADPEWANKVREGRTAEIRKCDRGLKDNNLCLVSLFLGKGVRCPVNPNAGREMYMQEYWQPPYKY